MTDTTSHGSVLSGGDLGKLFAAISQKGLGGAWAQVVESVRARIERRFDARYGIDCVDWIPVSELTVASPNKGLANIYGPTPAWLMPRFLRSIPEDLSVAGYDDHPIARVVSPALTSVEWGMTDVAVHASELLAAAVASEPQPGGRAKVQVTPRLIARASTAAI